MFITDDQLFELKYRLNSKYFGKTLAEIFLEELIRFNSGTSSTSRLGVIDAIKPYYHRFIDDFCEVKFQDDSILIIKIENDEWKSCEVYKGGFAQLVTEYSRV